MKTTIKKIFGKTNKAVFHNPGCRFVLGVTGMMAGTALLMASCSESEKSMPVTPDETITLTTTWDDTNLSSAPQAGYTVAVADFKAKVTQNPMSLDNVFDPGDYKVYVYTDAGKVTIGGSKANTIASVTAEDGGSGDIISSEPDFFYSGTNEVTVEKGKAQNVTVPMHQQVRELTLVIRPEGGAASKVTEVSASLAGVARAWNLDANTVSGDPASVNPTFAKEGDDHKATVRLLGINGSSQTLEGRIDFDGLPGIEFSKELNGVEGFADFNTDKKTPLVLQAQLVEVNDEIQLGDFEIISDWTIDEESFILFSAEELKPGDFYYDDNTVSDGGLRWMNKDNYALGYAAGAIAPVSGKNCVGIVVHVYNDREGLVVNVKRWSPESWGAGGVDESVNVADIRDQNSGLNGTNNMIDRYSSNFGLYKPFSVAYQANGNKKQNDGYGWFVPAREELRTLFTLYSGLSQVAGQWNPGDEMPGYDSSKAVAAREAFNAKLTAAEGDPIQANIHYTSAEISANNVTGMDMAAGKAVDHAKTTGASLRLMKHFDLDYVAPTPEGFKVGDYWPSDEDPEGVVYWLDPSAEGYDDTESVPVGKHGKVVNLGEFQGRWGDGFTPISASDQNDGRSNMNALITYLASDDNWLNMTMDDDYPIFAWAHKLNPTGTTYAAGKKEVWYLPAINELMVLRNVWNGGSGGTEVGGMRTTFSALFTAKSGTGFTAATYYHSSTEEGIGMYIYYVNFSAGTSASGMKGSSRVRAVLEF